MKKSKGMQLGAMLAAMLLLSIAFVPAVSAQGANESKGINPSRSSTGNRKTY